MASKVSSFSSEQSNEKDLMMDKLYWVKQLLSIILGCAAGGLDLTGFPVVVIYGIIISACSLVYIWQVLKNEEIEAWDIVSESFGPSFFCFMLLWVLTYTFL